MGPSFVRTCTIMSLAATMLSLPGWWWCEAVGLLLVVDDVAAGKAEACRVHHRSSGMEGVSG